MGMIQPQVGCWYRRLDGTLFEVVALDEDDGTVELQEFDGTVDELEIEAWHRLVLEPTAAPEDYSGAVDVEAGDGPTDDDGTGAQPAVDPLVFVDRAD